MGWLGLPVHLLARSSTEWDTGGEEYQEKRTVDMSNAIFPVILRNRLDIVDW